MAAVALCCFFVRLEKKTASKSFFSSMMLQKMRPMTTVPYQSIAQCVARKSRKNGTFSCPTHVFTQGQWWSKRGTQ